MPTYRNASPALSHKQVKAVRAAQNALRKAVDWSQDAEEVEAEYSRLLMAVGRGEIEEYLRQLSDEEPEEEDGVVWRVAVRSPTNVMTTFGWVKVERPLVRAKRNGPTRCLVTERAGLFAETWTPRAAKISAMATAELPFARAAALFRELGGMAPSSTLLQRLSRELLDLWETDRFKHEAEVRRSCPIPESAATLVVSLDGVMVRMVGSGADRAEKVAQTKAEGRAAKGPAGQREGAVGVVSLYDVAGDRLATWRMGRMPEENKEAVKAWLRAEVDWIRAKRPDIKVVAAADGAANNWSFLTSLRPDIEVVDFFHTVAHVALRLSIANGASTLDTQQKIRDAAHVLRDKEGGAKRVFVDLDLAREAAGTLPPSVKKTKGKRQPTFFQRHLDRMNYPALRAQNVPIGTGVTEGTCRHLVVDRLRRSGMTWSEAGGQAVMNLRGHLVSDRFDAGWACLTRANARRHRRAA
jgi:hypothetical protein